jgi:hypothetical protein
VKKERSAFIWTIRRAKSSAPAAILFKTGRAAGW